MSIFKLIAKYCKTTSRQLIKSVLPQTYDQSLTQDAFKKLHERYSLSDFLSYRYADEGGIWLADNPNGMDSYLIGFELSPLIIAGDRATKHLEALLSVLPIGASIHSIAHATSDVHGFLEKWVMARRSSSNPICDTLTKRRVKYMIDWIFGTISINRSHILKPRLIRYYIFIRIPANYSNTSVENQALFIKDIDAIINKSLSAIKSAGFGLSRLSGSAMTLVIRLLANLHRNPIDCREERVSVSMPIAPQIISPNTMLIVGNQGDLQFGSINKKSDKLVRLFTTHEFPDSPFHLHQMANCIGSIQRANSYMPGEFYAYTIVEILNTDIVQQKAMAKMALLQHQTAGSSKWYRSVMRHLYQREKNVEMLYDAMSKRGEKAVKAWSGIVIAGSTPESLEEATNIIKSEWDHARLKIFQETTIALPMWLTSLPGQYCKERDGEVHGLQRGTTMTALNAATLFHVQGDWQGSHPDQGGLLLISRRGVLTAINMFESLTNYNGVMAAASGSGKSFTTNEMATDFLCRGGMVRIIDAGRSYYNTAEILKGQNLVFKRGQGICINPFSGINTVDDLHEEMETLVTLVAQMAFPFGFGQIDMKDIPKSFEYRLIEEAITEVWTEIGSRMSIVDLTIWFSKQTDERLLDVARQLRPWAYGRYAEWMVGESNVKFNNPFLVIELDDLSVEPELQGVVMNLVLAKIQREMYLNTAKELEQYGYKLPKLVIIDEAWNLLAKPNTGSFIESAYRRARKYQGSIWIITQSFWDCDKTAAARVALDNSNWMMGLMQDSGPLKQAVAKGLIDLSEYALGLINSLQKTDDYAELYLINKSTRGEGLYRLVVDPITYWTYTTKGSERVQLEALLASGLSMDKAIIQLATGV
jgi:conjugal transfer ATP-binding protein TraC